jgi:hypothetical protein
VADQALEIQAAKNFVTHVEPALHRSQAFQALPKHTQAKILHDLRTIGQAFGEQPRDPYDFTLDTPEDFYRRRAGGSPEPSNGTTPAQQPAAPGPAGSGAPGPTRAATETIAARAGALSDEINFPAFVAGLVHGTFDAIVDATIRQMEAFADLVSSVAKDVDQFTRENVTTNHVRDWLAEQYPRDLKVQLPGADGGEPRLTAVSPATPDESDGNSPAWLTDYGLEGEQLTDELVETQLIPAARRSVGESRLKLLASMVLLGMSRVNVKDGTISARVRFRAAASDKALVNYAVSSDPGGPTWSERGSAVYDNHQTMVSTVGVNVQADSELKVELFGEVKINFVSETLPLERFADAARLRLLQRNARVPEATAAPVAPALPAAPPPVEPAAPATAAPPATAASPAAAAAPRPAAPAQPTTGGAAR